MTRFSARFNIANADAEEWFDPWLDSDTRLFVDPFLLFEDADDHWQAAHRDLVAFFNQALIFIAEARSERHPSWIRARGMLQFPEPDEFCLGFGESTTLGAGSGRRLGSLIMTAAREAIDRGIDHVEHFEELALFGEGFGADRISDIVCNVAKERFISYTQSVCAARSIMTGNVRIRNARWSRQSFQWRHETVTLPVNPHSGHGVLLVPKRFLRVLPSLDADEFWEYMWSNENDQLRNDFGDDLRRHVNRRQIIAYARRRRTAVNRFVAHQRLTTTRGYDIATDPEFRVRLRAGAESIAGSVDVPRLDTADICAFTSSLIQNFKHCVEQRGASRLSGVG